MAKIEVLGHCLEAAYAQNHLQTVSEQVNRDGKPHKVIAGLRLLPNFVTRSIVDCLSQDRLPFNLDVQQPLGYGYEAIVYPAGDGQKVVKRFMANSNAETQLASRLRNHELYQRCYGEMVVKTSFAVVESSYRRGKATVAAVQPMIEGVPLFSNFDLANSDQLEELHVGTRRMQAGFNSTPDFCNVDQVLVDASGDLHIVDTGLVLPNEFVPRDNRLAENLSALSAAAQGRFATAA